MDIHGYQDSVQKSKPQTGTHTVTAHSEEVLKRQAKPRVLLFDSGIPQISLEKSQ